MPDNLALDPPDLSGLKEANNYKTKIYVCMSFNSVLLRTFSKNLPFNYMSLKKFHNKDNFLQSLTD